MFLKYRVYLGGNQGNPIAKPFDVNTVDALGIDPKLLKCCSDLRALIWTDIFNTSLELGIDPNLKAIKRNPVKLPSSVASYADLEKGENMQFCK